MIVSSLHRMRMTDRTDGEAPEAYLARAV